jgi:hypothetical protein
LVARCTKTHARLSLIERRLAEILLNCGVFWKRLRARNMKKVTIASCLGFFVVARLNWFAPSRGRKIFRQEGITQNLEEKLPAVREIAKCAVDVLLFQLISLFILARIHTATNLESPVLYYLHS